MSKQAQASNDAKDQGPYWWDTTPLGEARHAFREQLKSQRHDPDECAWKWMQYFGVANIDGRVGHAARCFPHLMAYRHGGRAPLIEQLPQKHLRGLLLLGFRATITLAEFPETSLDELARAQDFVMRLATRASVPQSALTFLRLALAIRTGRADRHVDDYQLARDTWKSDEDSVGVACNAGRAAILVEWLTAMERDAEAFQLFEEAESCDPCIAPCGLAPQLTLSHIVGALLRAGKRTQAHAILQRLAAAAPVSRAWLLPVGSRIAALTELGAIAEARELFELALPLASDPDIPAWSRLHFHLGASRLLSAAGARRDLRMADAHQAEADHLSAALDVRNGNSNCTAWATRHYTL